MLINIFLNDIEDNHYRNRAFLSTASYRQDVIFLFRVQFRHILSSTFDFSTF